MHFYIIKTKHAVNSLFELINYEQNSLIEAMKNKELFENAEKDLFENNKNSLTPEIIIEIFGFNNAAPEKQKEIHEIKNRINISKFSIASLSGAILQIAKQGISFVYGNLVKCPNGRTIGSQYIKEIIWHARNQSMHFEEGNFKLPLINCFQLLENDFGAEFSTINYTTKNLGNNIIQLLKWKEYADYESDMIHLLG